MSAQPLDRTTFALDLVNRAAPELTPTIGAIVNQIKPSFIEEGDFAGFHFGTIYNRIAFNERAIAIKWLLGHAAWQAIEHYSGALKAWVILRMPITSADVLGLRDLSGQLALSTRLSQDASTLIAVSDINNFLWPSGIPNPLTQSGSVQQAATSELVQLALCFTFLHELRHAIFIHAGVPYGGKAEELICDKFAADHLLRDAASYASGTQWTVEEVVAKRASGIALGCFIIGSISPAGGPNHPSAGERLRAVCLPVQLPSNSYYWVLLSSLIVSLLAMQGALPASIRYTDEKDLAVQLASYL